MVKRAGGTRDRDASLLKYTLPPAPPGSSTRALGFCFNMSTSRFYDHVEVPSTEMVVHQFTTAQPSRTEGMREAGMLAVCHTTLESGWRSVRELSPPAKLNGYA
jgi:hypothetical protein